VCCGKAVRAACLRTSSASSAASASAAGAEVTVPTGFILSALMLVGTDATHPGCSRVSFSFFGLCARAHAERRGRGGCALRAAWNGGGKAMGAADSRRLACLRETVGARAQGDVERRRRTFLEEPTPPRDPALLFFLAEGRTAPGGTVRKPLPPTYDTGGEKPQRGMRTLRRMRGRRQSGEAWRVQGARSGVSRDQRTSACCVLPPPFS
jgi:hypothetical protein